MADKQIEQPCRGRQAEARRNDQAVLEAARQVFAVLGPDASVRDIAAKAGVGMGSLYRRYAGKDELLQQLCRQSLAQQSAAAEAALESGDEPWEALAGFIRTCVSFRAGAFAAIAGAVPVTGELQAAAQQAHDLLEQLVSQAQQAGVLRRDVGSVDILQLLELFSRRPADDQSHQRLLALLLDGLKAPGRESLPGAPGIWDAYASRWSNGHATCRQQKSTTAGI